MELYDNIPDLLKHWPHWVVWGVNPERLKEPFNPASVLYGRPEPAKAGIKETWGAYQTAVECVVRGLAKGIGYEFNNGGIIGVDLDHVLSEDGALTSEAAEIVTALNSYTEISPSGNGLHIFVIGRDRNGTGAVITRHRKKDFCLEIYGEARYFTVTGNIYGGATRPIEKRAAELQGVHDKFLADGRPDNCRANQKQNSNHQNDSVINFLAKAVSNSGTAFFLEKGLSRDKVLQAMWRGERRHGNESADDQALMNKLAYWCNADPDAVLAAFFQSPYFAGKDEKHTRKCERADYLMNTASKACDTVNSTAKEDYDKYRQNKKKSEETR